MTAPSIIAQHPDPLDSRRAPPYPGVRRADRRKAGPPALRRLPSGGPDERDRPVLHARPRARPALPCEDPLAGGGHGGGACPDRATESEAERLPHGHGRSRARARAGRRGAPRARPASRSAGRHPVLHQGSRADGGHQDDVRIQVLRAQRPGRGRRGRLEAPRLRGRAARQDEHAPLWLQGHVRQPDRPAVQEPLEPRPHVGRLLGRRGGRGRGRARPPGPRLRRLRLDPHPLGALRDLRPQALARPRALLAERGSLERPLAQRPDDADRPGRGDPAAGPGGPRRARPALDRRAAGGLSRRLRGRRARLARGLERRPRLRLGRTRRSRS